MKKMLNGITATDHSAMDRKVWGPKCCNYTIKKRYTKQKIGRSDFPKNSIWSVI